MQVLPLSRWGGKGHGNDILNILPQLLSDCFSPNTFQVAPKHKNNSKGPYAA